MENKSEKKKISTAKKRMLQNEKSRKRNAFSKMKVKVATKKLTMIAAKETVKGEAKSIEASPERKAAVYNTQSKIDKARKIKSISKGRAQRLISKIYKNNI